MEFIKSKTKDYYMLDTRVENVFISEYLPGAPGDYVKVFLYGYMCADNGISAKTGEIASQLNISEKDVEKAWSYWEKMGAVKKKYLNEGDIDFAIEFVSLKELMYGKAREPEIADDAPEANIFGNENVKKVFEKIEQLLSRNLSSTELTDVISWMEEDNIDPQVVLYGFEYSLEKDKASIKYVGKVVHSWHEEGYYTVDQVKEHLAEVDSRFYEYKRVLTALGMNRMPTEGEKKMMDSWFDELGYSMDKVLEACDKTVGITTPNFSYVNKVLENWANEAEKTNRDVNASTVSQSTLNKYLSYLREKEEREAFERREEAYSKVPRIKEIDDEISKLGAKLSKDLLMGKETGEARETRDEIEKLSEERAFLLTENGLPMDHTDIRYKCDKCNDTGITDLGERCTCIGERMEEAAVWAKSRK